MLPAEVPSRFGPVRVLVMSLPKLPYPVLPSMIIIVALARRPVTGTTDPLLKVVFPREVSAAQAGRPTNFKAHLLGPVPVSLA